METATVEPGNDPMREQNEGEDPQRERRLLAARSHAFAQAANETIITAAKIAR